MCGILGAFAFNDKRLSENVFNEALEYLNHRGPDYKNTYIKGNIALGHTRLSIIDLRSDANQPFHSENGMFCLVFNGEIYNYRELKKYLFTRGCIFKTESDTEVLLNGLILEGESFIAKCEGMFSFAFFDKLNETLLLVRDRLGIKPLYYFRDNEKIIFSSEIKPILKIVQKYSINYSVLKNFVRFRYHPGSETPFRDIYHLEPGYLLKLNNKGKIELKSYWSLNNLNVIEKQNTAIALEEFYYRFSSSVKSQLISDVPLGVFLSGGVDSSSIFSLASRQISHLNAFTIGLGTIDDEIDKAKSICLSRNGIFNYSLVNGQDLSIYKKALWHLEEPLADSIISATFQLAKFARSKVKVVLAGEGADEILGGYVHHKALAYQKKIVDARLGGLATVFVQYAPVSFLQKLFPYQANLGESGIKKIRLQISQMGQWGIAYERLVEVFGEDIFDIESDEARFNNSVWNELWSKNPKSEDFLNDLTRFDLKYWNSKYTLLRLDKLTMAHGLEARVPFLDSKLTELALTLPQNLKLKFQKDKWILRKSMYKYGVLTKEESYRKKQAFYLPIEKTYGKKIIEFAADNLLSQKSLNRKFFNRSFVEEIVRSNYEEILISKQLMSLLVFELWAQLFIDGEWEK